MSRRTWGGAAAILVALALAGAGCGGGGDGDDGSGGGSAGGGSAREVQTTTTRVQVVEGLGDGSGFDAREIYKRESPGVVTIVSLFEGSGGGGPAPGENGGAGGAQQGQGSGFVLNGEGDVATNAHVVTDGEGPQTRRAKEVYVEFGDGNQVPAKILGTDPNADIALLRIDPAGLKLTPLPLGSSEGIPVGSPVVAMGSPFGEQQSLSVGVVSATDRSIQSLTGFQISGAIQTDAPINPGNSGGPLLNENGEVIGVNQQIKSRSGGGEGVGFAVPIDVAKRSLDQLRKDGRAEYAYLGVSSAALYPQLVDRFKLPVKQGAWVQEATPGGPAQDADLKGGGRQERFQARAYLVGGDIITKIDDATVSGPDDLSTLLGRYKPGDKVTLEVYRDGERRTVEVTLGSRPVTAEQTPR